MRQYYGEQGQEDRLGSYYISDARVRGQRLGRCRGGMVRKGTFSYIFKCRLGVAEP